MYYGATVSLTNDTILGGNWAKGPAGTGEFDLNYGMEGFDFLTGYLAESWELPDLLTRIFHIRKGVHYGLNPASEASRLVNGRGLTADDIVFNHIRHATSPAAFGYSTFRAESITQPDKWTVVLKYDPTKTLSVGPSPFADMGSSVMDYPREVIEKYGNMLDWRNSVGTGPFMLTDFVAGSSATLVRNPNYYMTDPVEPGKSLGNKLPYVDTVKILVIPDISTRMAALRTARVDQIPNVMWEDAAPLLKGTPKLQYKRLFSATDVINMRMDKPELPFKDVRVRQALTMAIDYPSLVKDFYAGQADIMSYPWWPAKAWKNVRIPLEQLPANVQELYSYNPTKAKQLLAEAGYPNGFKTRIVTSSASASVDLASVIKAYWAKIGVDLEIQPKEAGVLTAITSAYSWEEMMLSFYGRMAAYLETNYQTFRDITNVPPRIPYNAYITEMILKANTYRFVDTPALERTLRELTPYYLLQAFHIPRPGLYNYIIWWPWVKGYHGETMTNQANAWIGWIPFVWVDQDLKKEMTGK